MDIRLQDPSLQALQRPKPPAQPAGAPSRIGRSHSEASSVYLSGKLPAVILEDAGKGQTRLVRDEREKTENGFRRAQEFETSDGRGFSRSEEFILTQAGSRRLVVQQNASGSVTSFEIVVDKLEDGNFRRTSRFTDETGNTETKIEVDLNAAQIASGQPGAGPLSTYHHIQNYTDPRGGHIDLSA